LRKRVENEKAMKPKGGKMQFSYKIPKGFTINQNPNHQQQQQEQQQQSSAAINEIISNAVAAQRIKDEKKLRKKRPEQQQQQPSTHLPPKSPNTKKINGISQPKWVPSNNFNHSNDTKRINPSKPSLNKSNSMTNLKSGHFTAVPSSLFQKSTSKNEWKTVGKMKQNPGIYLSSQDLRDPVSTKRKNIHTRQPLKRPHLGIGEMSKFGSTSDYNLQSSSIGDSSSTPFSSNKLRSSVGSRYKDTPSNPSKKPVFIDDKDVGGGWKPAGHKKVINLLLLL
jgi:hypothetical protein